MILSLFIKGFDSNWPCKSTHNLKIIYFYFFNLNEHIPTHLLLHYVVVKLTLCYLLLFRFQEFVFPVEGQFPISEVTAAL